MEECVRTLCSCQQESCNLEFVTRAYLEFLLLVTGNIVWESDVHTKTWKEILNMVVKTSINYISIKINLEMLGVKFSQDFSSHTFEKFNSPIPD